MSPKRMRLGDLRPTQPDDGIPPRTRSPIEVCKDGDRYLVVHGNHRYYTALAEKGEDGSIDVKHVKNPYTN